MLFFLFRQILVRRMKWTVFQDQPICINSYIRQRTTINLNIQIWLLVTGSEISLHLVFSFKTNQTAQIKSPRSRSTMLNMQIESFLYWCTKYSRLALCKFMPLSYNSNTVPVRYNFIISIHSKEIQVSYPNTPIFIADWLLVGWIIISGCYCGLSTLFSRPRKEPRLTGNNSRRNNYILSNELHLLHIDRW